MVDVNTDLIRRAQQGDTQILSDLYEKYHLGIYRYLFYRTGERQVAEDLTSEVFERMLRFVGRLEASGANFHAWLFQIARNLANDHFRALHSRPQVHLDDDLPGQDDGAERQLTSSELQRALGELVDEQRDVLLLRFIAGMPIAAAAEALNKSEDAVKGLQRRGLIALRQILIDGNVENE